MSEASVVEDRRRARLALNTAHASLRVAAAELSKHMQLTGDDAVAIRNALKAGRSIRRVPTRALWAEARRCLQLSFDLTSRLEGYTLTLAGGSVSSDGTADDVSQHSAPRRKRRRRPRKRTMLELPAQFEAERDAQGALPLDAAPAEDVPEGQGTSKGDYVAPRVRIEEFSQDEDILDQISQRRQVINVMKTGLSAAAALEKLKLEATPNRVRWAQRTYKTFLTEGRAVDRRHLRKNPSTVMTERVQVLVLKIWNGRTAATDVEITRQVGLKIKEEIAKAKAAGRKLELEVPSVETVRRFLRSLPKAVVLARGGDLALFEKKARLVGEYDPTEYSNHMWQADHTPLDVWIRIQVRPGVWEEAKCNLTVVLDVHSRAIMGWFVSLAEPTAWTTALVLRKGILGTGKSVLRGLPHTFVPDHGPDFMSHQVARLCTALGLVLDPCPPSFPDMKAEIERWFLTVKLKLSGLVGYTHAHMKSAGAAAKRIPMLLTREQLCAEIARIIEEYNNTLHSATGEVPLVRWKKTVRLNVLPEKDLLEMLLQVEHRVVQHDGIHFNKGCYVSPALPDRMSERVLIRFNPEDQQSVLVYEEISGRFICEAGRFGDVVTADDLKGWNRAYRGSLIERTREYAADIERDDLVSARTWDDAQDTADAWQEADDARSTPRGNGAATEGSPATPPMTSGASTTDGGADSAQPNHVPSTDPPTTPSGASLRARWKQRDRAAVVAPAQPRTVPDE